MANSLYGKARQALASAQIDWVTDTIKVQLVDTAAYTVNINADEFLTSIPSGARIGTAQTLASKTNVLGVLDGADSSFTGLVAAPSIEAIAIYKDTGTEGTSRLIAYIDSAAGLPAAEGATTINIAWDNGANKIARI